MKKYEIIKGKPNNIHDLRKKVKNKNSGADRIAVVEELKKYDCKEAKNILRELLKSDKVWNVKHKAFLALQSFGENVRLPKKKKGHLINDINKKIAVVNNSFEGKDYSIEDFNEKFKAFYPEAYDVYQWDKGAKFNEWVQNVLGNSPKK